MKQILLTGALLLGCTQVNAADRRSPNVREVRSALYCLTHGENPLLSPDRDSKFSVIYGSDDKIFPGQHGLFVFAKRERDRYDAFVIVVSGRVFDVRNNATLKNGRGGVTYVNDPLGGVWTHDSVAAQFVKALKQRPVLIASEPPPVPRPMCRQFGARASVR